MSAGADAGLFKVVQDLSTRCNHLIGDEAERRSITGGDRINLQVNVLVTLLSATLCTAARLQVGEDPEQFTVSTLQIVMQGTVNKTLEMLASGPVEPVH